MKSIMATERPEFILGTVQLGMNYGVQNHSRSQLLEVKDRISILERAHQLGIRSLDTANNYGESQKLIGHFDNRSDFKILSKFILSKESPRVKTHFEQALQSLGVQTLEAFSFHRFDDIYNYPQAVSELVQLKNEGLIKYIGVSLYSGGQIEKVLKIPEIELIQLPFNVLDNFSQRGVLLKKATNAKKILHARSAFLQGLLLMPVDQIPRSLQSAVPSIKSLQQIAIRSKITMECLCMGYILQQNLFSGLVIGVDNKDQLSRNFQDYNGAGMTEIDTDEINKIKVEDARILDPSLWGNL